MDVFLLILRAVSLNSFFLEPVLIYTAEKLKLFVKDLFNKCDQIHWAKSKIAEEILNVNCKFYCKSFYSVIQKQPSRGVLMKRCSENMQQIHRRTSMPKFDFNKVGMESLY